MAKFCIVFPDGIPEDDKDEYRSRFAAGESCEWCGGIHNATCPRVKKIMYHPNDDRQIREIEFWGEGDWSRANIVFPEDVI